MSATAGGASATAGRGEGRPVADEDRDRSGEDEEDDQGHGAAAAAAAPHPVSGGADLIGWEGSARSAGRVVSAAYSRSATTASNAVWLRPTKRRPSPGRAWSSRRRSAAVRSK